MKKSEKEVKESKEIRTRSRETDVTDVTENSTTWHPPGLRRSTLDSWALAVFVKSVRKL